MGMPVPLVALRCVPCPFLFRPPMEEYRLLKKTAKILSLFSLIASLSLIVLSYCSDYFMILSCFAYFFSGIFAGMAVIYMIILKKEEEKFTEETIKRIREKIVNMNVSNSYNGE